MVFWLIAALMTLGTLALLFFPLLRVPKNMTATRLDGARNVLRDQLGEIDRDLELASISAPEGEAARAEVARRLLALEREVEAESSTKATWSTKTAQAVTLLILPLLAFGTYVFVGAPHLPDQTVATRLQAPVQQQDIAVLISSVEAHLAKNPNDAKGWETLVPIYLRMRESEKAVNALRKALAIGGQDDATRQQLTVTLAEVLSFLNDNVVTMEAAKLFSSVAAENPSFEKARFYEAIALTQSGNKEAAIDAWQRLIVDLGEGNPPWLDEANAQLTALQAGESDGSPQKLGTPSKDDIEAADEMNAQDRGAMIEGMVASLAARLEEQPNDPTGWQRLIRSYIVLGRFDDAKGALRTAQRALSGNEQAQVVLDAFENELKQRDQN